MYPNKPRTGWEFCENLRPLAHSSREPIPNVATSHWHVGHAGAKLIRVSVSTWRLPLPTMPRFAVATSLPPAASALGFRATPPRVLQALTLDAAASPPPWRRRLCLCSSSSSSTAAAVEEARRGRKQLGVTPQLYDYLLANVREHPVRPPHPLSVYLSCFWTNCCNLGEYFAGSCVLSSVCVFVYHILDMHFRSFGSFAKRRRPWEEARCRYTCIHKLT